jgi:hypothetical protein
MARSTASVFSVELNKAASSGTIPKKSVEARDWLRSQATSVKRANPKAIMERNTSKFTNLMIPGMLYLFNYDPKGKDDLPFYDKFPLVFPFKKLPDGFIGLNMHYLPHPYRARLMDALYDLTNNKRYDPTTKLRLSYQMLQSASKYRYFEPCVKRYLTSHLKSRLLHIDSSEWETALFLPLERFAKASKDKVWLDSRNVIGRS